MPSTSISTPTPTPQKSFFWIFVILFLISTGITGWLYYQNLQLKQQLINSQQASQSQIVPNIIPPESSPTSSSPTPSTKPTATIEPIIIPSNWKQFTAIDPEFKIKTTMSMPPGFSFSFTGSEFTIQNDSDATELWDYSTSVFSGKDGLKNYYDGTSRRDWYKRKLDGEFTSPEEFQKKRGDILSVIEHNINNQSYLEISVNDLNSGDIQKHYLFVNNGMIHIIKPASHEANNSTALMPKYLDIIFTSLTSTTIK